MYTIKNKSKVVVLSESAKIASSFFSRLRGLMFKKSLNEQNALIFINAPSIHTFFMRFPIDILFLDKGMRIIRICQSIYPGRCVFCLNSAFTIEFPAFRLEKLNVEIGDILEFYPQTSS